MRHWIEDRTGRFERRPFYTYTDLDQLAENRVSKFLRRRYGRVKYPISTDDLTVMIEQDVSDLDLYCDFPSGDIEGATNFIRGKKPRIKISRALTESCRRENRLRTTLCHEWGHVILQDCL
jgi:hypothetical protein